MGKKVDQYKRKGYVYHPRKDEVNSSNSLGEDAEHTDTQADTHTDTQKEHVLTIRI